MKLRQFARNCFTTRYVSGDWNAIDDVSGLQHKASDLALQWDGLRVAADDVEERHPQDFLRSVPDKIRVPWTRPDSTRFVSGT